MNIDERLEKAREASWEVCEATYGTTYWRASWAAYWAAYGAASKATYWASSDTASFASQCEECSYRTQIDILKRLLDEHR